MTPYQELKNDPDLLEERLCNDICKDIVTALAMNAGHTRIHMNNEETTKQMLTRIIDEKVSGAGSFVSEELAMDLIENVVYNKAHEIAVWATKTRGEFESTADYQQLALTVVVEPGEVAGINIDSRFREISTDATRIVLQRDYSDTSPYGFYLKTAYPDADTKRGYGTPTGKVYTKEEIVEKGLYDFHSDMQKAAFLMDGKPGIRVKLLEDNGQEQLRLTAKRGDTYYVAYIKEPGENNKFIRSENGAKEKITVETLVTECPELAMAFGEAIRYRDGGKSFAEMVRPGTPPAERERKAPERREKRTFREDSFILSM